MNTQQKAIMLLVKSALTGEHFPLPEDFDFEAAVLTAKKHQIAPMIYYGALQCGISPKAPQMQKLFVQTCQYVAVNEKQMQAVDEIFKAFDEAKIDYMPLKGTLLKAMYPKPEMRSMSDADILIQCQQYARIKPIMQELGYSEGVESDHELVWQKPYIHIELHKRLIPSYNKDYYDYFGDGWRLAKPVETQPNRYVMTAEDEFIYLFTHYAKHYRDAGIGIKHFADLWVYRSKADLDEAYILQELKKLQLDVFYENTVKALNAWFADGEMDPVAELICATVFQSGVYGTHEAHLLSDAVKMSKTTQTTKKARRKKILAVVFPGYKAMCQRHPVLKKAPVLLPVMWVVRWVKTLFLSGHKIKQKREDIKTISVDRIDGYQQALNAVGLDFNFKE